MPISKHVSSGAPFLNRVILIGIILVAVGTPLLFSLWSKNNFLMPKEVYAEGILIVLLGIYLISWIAIS